jgi:hypothetical protein
MDEAIEVPTVSKIYIYIDRLIQELQIKAPIC